MVISVTGSFNPIVNGKGSQQLLVFADFMASTFDMWRIPAERCFEEMSNSIRHKISSQTKSLPKVTVAC